MLKKYALLIAVVYTILLSTISLVSIKGIPDVGISFGDKIFHFLAYFLLTFLCFNAFVFKYGFTKKKALICTVVFSMVFGIIIEALQGMITSSRLSDIYDAAANGFGVLLATWVLLVKNKIQIK